MGGPSKRPYGMKLISIEKGITIDVEPEKKERPKPDNKPIDFVMIDGEKVKIPKLKGGE